MRASRALFLASALVLSASAGIAASQTFTDTTLVTAVEIPVQVLLDGKPVGGLTADDFAVYQEKSKQEITGFDVVGLYSLPESTAPTAAAEVMPAARRQEATAGPWLVVREAPRQGRREPAAKESKKEDS